MKRILLSGFLLLAALPAVAQVVQSNGTALSVAPVNIGSSTFVTGTLLTAAVPAFTGDVTNSAGSLTTSVGKINGVALGTTTALPLTGTANLLSSTTYYAMYICGGV